MYVNNSQKFNFQIDFHTSKSLGGAIALPDPPVDLPLEKVTSISLIQPVLTVLLKRHLKQSAFDAKIIADLKSIIVENIKDRFRNTD